MFKRLIAMALACAGPIALTAAPLTLAAQSSPADARSSCGTGYYVNSRGNCIPRPRHSNSVPSGASAQCRDGTYSFSQSRRGTCSHHGGVSRWL